MAARPLRPAANLLSGVSWPALKLSGSGPIGLLLLETPAVSGEQNQPGNLKSRAAESESESVGVGCFARSRSRQNLPTPTDSGQDLIPDSQIANAHYLSIFSVYIFAVGWLDD